MNELALFAGAGGGILGTKLLGWRAVCAVEINPYCREVLLRRQEERILEAFPIWDDVRTFNGKPWRGKVDVITAGFPCQPWSVAGKQKGEADERNLWPDTIRIIREVRPRWVFLENVPALLAHGYFGTILRNLAEGGYDARWKVISAAEVGAPHLRNRVWIVAHDDITRFTWPRPDSTKEDTKSNRRHDSRRGSQDVADTSINGLEGSIQAGNGITKTREFSKGCEITRRISKEKLLYTNKTETTRQRKDSGEIYYESKPTRFDIASSSEWWAVEPELGRVAHGVAYRVDRLKALGEGQVPAVVRVAWELLRCR